MTASRSNSLRDGIAFGEPHRFSSRVTAFTVLTTFTMPAATPKKKNTMTKMRRGAEPAVEQVADAEADDDGEDEAEADGAQRAEGADGGLQGLDGLRAHGSGLREAGSECRPRLLAYRSVAAMPATPSVLAETSARSNSGRG